MPQESVLECGMRHLDEVTQQPRGIPTVVVYPYASPYRMVGGMAPSAEEATQQNTRQNEGLHDHLWYDSTGIAVVLAWTCAWSAPLWILRHVAPRSLAHPAR